MTIHQDVDLYTGLLGEGDSVSQRLAEGRRAWVQIAKGSATLNGSQLYPGDGAAVADETAIGITATDQTEVLLFDMK